MCKGLGELVKYHHNKFKTIYVESFLLSVIVKIISSVYLRFPQVVLVVDVFHQKLIFIEKNIKIREKCLWNRFLWTRFYTKEHMFTLLKQSTLCINSENLFVIEFVFFAVSPRGEELDGRKRGVGGWIKFAGGFSSHAQRTGFGGKQSYWTCKQTSHRINFKFSSHPTSKKSRSFCWPKILSLLPKQKNLAKYFECALWQIWRLSKVFDFAAVAALFELSIVVTQMFTIWKLDCSRVVVVQQRPSNCCVARSVLRVKFDKNFNTSVSISESLLLFWYILRMSHQFLDCSGGSESSLTSLSPSLSPSMTSMNASLEIRSIVNDYNDSLRTATEEIKSLTR